MKKLLIKDKKIRSNIKKFERLRFILKTIFNNSNFCDLVRLNAFYKLSLLSISNSKILLSNRCVETINKKKFSKLSNFSRVVFLKRVRNGEVNGVSKYYW